MNEREGTPSPNGRPTRVVSLPCGHRLYVDLNATLLAVSGPVMDHQASCHPTRAPPVPAWFADVHLSSETFVRTAARPPVTPSLVVEARPA